MAVDRFADEDGESLADDVVLALADMGVDSLADMRIGYCHPTGLQQFTALLDGYSAETAVGIARTGLLELLSQVGRFHLQKS